MIALTQTLAGVGPASLSQGIIILWDRRGMLIRAYSHLHLPGAVIGMTETERAL